ncbi:hypothetical protein ILUMI_14205, partial [Ignelater luminosus]
METFTFLLIACSCTVIQSWSEDDTNIPYYDDDIIACPEHEVYNSCGLNCTKTCFHLNPPCSTKCIKKCECRNGFYRNRWGECVSYDDCYSDYIVSM